MVFSSKDSNSTLHCARRKAMLRGTEGSKAQASLCHHAREDCQ